MLEPKGMLTAGITLTSDGVMSTLETMMVILINQNSAMWKLIGVMEIPPNGRRDLKNKMLGGAMTMNFKTAWRNIPLSSLTLMLMEEKLSILKTSLKTKDSGVMEMMERDGLKGTSKRVNAN